MEDLEDKLEKIDCLLTHQNNRPKEVLNNGSTEANILYPTLI
jgi:hypothetical protein